MGKQGTCRKAEVSDFTRTISTWNRYDQYTSTLHVWIEPNSMLTISTSSLTKAHTVLLLCVNEKISFVIVRPNLALVIEMEFHSF